MIATRETTSEWHERTIIEACKRGEDKPASWAVEFEDGLDGCMPAGYYVVGKDRLGFYMTSPVYHLYGQFRTQSEAVEVMNAAELAYKDVQCTT